MKSPRLKNEYDKSSKPSYLYSLENKKETSLTHGQNLSATRYTM